MSQYQLPNYPITRLPNYEILLMSPIVLVLTTVPSDALGEELATALVTERLAACVNVGAAMTSIYRWKGSVERETERQLVIKTTADRVTAVQQRIKELHPYELPEFVVIEVSGGSDEYLKWIIAESQS
jgi:periplasmic divalent cation tolerance protein